MTTTTTNTFQTYGNPQLPRFNAWVESVESQFPLESCLSDWTDYIFASTTDDSGEILPSGLDPFSNKIAWVEKTPYVRGDPSLNLLHEFFYGSKFDFDSPNFEERFEDFIEQHLNLHIAALWHPFMHVSASLQGYVSGDIRLVMPQLAQDFCDHALMWSYAQDVPLLKTPN
jgi:hypothetical protein